MRWNDAILTYLFSMSDRIIQTFTFSVSDPATFRHSLSDPAIQTFRPSHALHQTLSSIHIWPFHVRSAHSNIETHSHSLCQTMPLKQSLIQTLLVSQSDPSIHWFHHSLLFADSTIPCVRPLIQTPGALSCRSKVFEDIDRMIHPETIYDHIVYDLDGVVAGAGAAYCQENSNLSNRDELR